MFGDRETYRVVMWDAIQPEEFDLSRAFVAPMAMHVSDGGSRLSRVPQLALGIADLAIPLHKGAPPLHSFQFQKKLRRQTPGQPEPVEFAGLERILYEDVRAGRFYLEVAAPKSGEDGEYGIVRKYLRTEISVRCPRCQESDWALFRHTVRTVYDGRAELACYRITLVCKNCDRRLAGAGVALTAAWERCERSVAGAFRRITGFKLSGSKDSIEGTVTVDKADVRLRRC